MTQNSNGEVKMMAGVEKVILQRIVLKYFPLI